jgi:hypothetical protein
LAAARRSAAIGLAAAGTQFTRDRVLDDNMWGAFMSRLKTIFATVSLGATVDACVPPPAHRFSKEELEHVEIALHEYDAIRSEIHTSLGNQVSVLSFGAATVGLLVAAAAALWSTPGDGSSTLVAVLLLLMVPMVCFLSLAVYLGEQWRLTRAAFYVHSFEAAVSASFGGGALLHWEHWLRERDRAVGTVGQIDQKNRSAIMLVLTLLAIVFGSVGAVRLVVARPHLGAVVGLLALAVAIFAFAGNWVVRLTSAINRELLLCTPPDAGADGIVNLQRPEIATTD